MRTRKGAPSKVVRRRRCPMTARQHHHVSQCYLKGFVRDREAAKLFVIDAKEHRSFITSPKNVAVERDFHAVDFEGLPPDAFENDLSGFETELDNALRRIVATRSITKDENDRAYLLNFICLLAIKNPGLRENFRAAHEQTAKIMMDLATATPERWAAQVDRAKKAGFLRTDADIDYEKMREFVTRGEYRIETLTSMHLQIEMQTFDKILPLIFNRKWMLFKAPANTTGFVTSDHPMCLMWSDPAKRGGFWPPGLGLARTQLLFPISNELAAIGAFEIDEMETEATELQIAQINGSIILHARRQVYARDSDFLYKMQHNPTIMRGADLLNDQALSRGQEAAAARL
jgi:hypothetical protein